MKIGELARQTGVSTDTLRFYEERGLIRSQRAANGYRHYAVEIIELVKYIKLAQHLGFTLAQIGENLPLLWNAPQDSDEHLAQLFKEKIAALDERIAQMQALRNVLAERAGQPCPLRPGTTQERLEPR